MDHFALRTRRSRFVKLLQKCVVGWFFLYLACLVMVLLFGVKLLLVEIAFSCVAVELVLSKFHMFLPRIGRLLHLPLLLVRSCLLLLVTESYFLWVLVIVSSMIVQMRQLIGLPNHNHRNIIGFVYNSILFMVGLLLPEVLSCYKFVA